MAAFLKSISILLLFTSWALYNHASMKLGKNPSVAALPSLGVCLFAALCFAWGESRRAGGGLRGFLRTGAVLGGILALPLVAILLVPPAESKGIVSLSVGGAFLAVVYYVYLPSFVRQVRQSQPGRDLPDLEGPLREVAQTVMERAGLSVQDIKVCDLGGFNAEVCGYKEITLKVDRRAAESFQPDEFSALIAHEAGHARLGVHLPAAAAISLALAGYNAMVGAGWGQNGLVTLLACGLLLLVALARQVVELLCDRFAVKQTGADSVEKMLRKLFADLPSFWGRVTNSCLAIPFASHPPMWARQAAIGKKEGRRLGLYCTILGGTVIACLVIPILIHAGVRPDPSDARYANIAWGLPAAYIISRFFYHAWQYTSPLCSVKAYWGLGSRGGCLLWPVALSTLLLLAAAVWGVEGAILTACLWGFGLSLIAFLVAGILFLSGLLQVPLRVRRASQEVKKAVTQGRLEEGLRISQETFERYPTHPFVVVMHGNVLIRLGRFDEAEALLGKIVSSEPSFAATSLAIVHFLRGNVNDAAKLLDPTRGGARTDALAWYICGLMALESGDFDKADEFFAGGSRLKERRAATLAGRALVALERQAPLDDVQNWVDMAKSADPENPLLYLAEAALCHRRGEAEESSRSLARVLEKLEEQGMKVWAPYFSKLAIRLGLVEEEKGLT